MSVSSDDYHFEPMPPELRDAVKSIPIAPVYACPACGKVINSSILFRPKWCKFCSQTLSWKSIMAKDE